MAYTKAPTQDVYQTKTIPLIYDWNNRQQSTFTALSDPKQTVAQNVHFEKVVDQETGENYYNVIKRDGWEEEDTFGNAIIGTYYWENPDRIVVVTSTTIWMLDITTGIKTSTTTSVFSTSATKGLNFTEFLYEDGHSDLIICGEFAAGGLTTAGVFTQITDPDYPTTVLAYPVFLDGYLFIADTQGNIRNSDLNNPYSWTSSNFIAVESYPDYIKGLARVGSYVVALGTTSTEWFFDAANPTGTPLARVEGATQEIGYIQGLVGSENAIYFVGRSNRGQASVYKIVGLKITELGTPTVRRWLGTTSFLSSSRGHIFMMGGHRFYVVIQNRDFINPTQCYMYDLDEKMWTSLVLRNDNEGPFIFTSTTAFQKDITQAYGQVLTYFSEYQSNRLFVFRPEFYQDDASSANPVNFTCQFTTRPLDFGNYRNKFVSRLVFGTDQTSSTSLMSVSWSDNDLQTFNTPRTVNLANAYTPLYANGVFRKRAFKITYADNFPMRWRSVEIDYLQGDA